MGTEEQMKELMDMMSMAKAPDPDAYDEFEAPKYRRDRGSIAREEEMCELLRRQVALLERLVKAVEPAAAPAAQPSMDKPLQPARPRPSNE